MAIDTDAITNMEQHLKEGMLAIMPTYNSGEMGTIIYTLQGQYLDPRSISWLINALAAHYCLELTLLRRHYSRFLGVRRNISFPLDSGLVLLPVKTRKAENQGEATIGYINLLQVEDVLVLKPGTNSFAMGTHAEVEAAVADLRASYFTAPEQQKELNTGSGSSPGYHLDSPGEHRSLVLFKNGLVLGSLNARATLQERLCQGHRARQEFLRRRDGAALYPGLRRRDIMKLLPPCDCVLKDLFMGILNKGD